MRPEEKYLRFLTMKGEKENLIKCLEIGKIYGYGNVIYALKLAWKGDLLDAGLSEIAADFASRLKCACDKANK